MKDMRVEVKLLTCPLLYEELPGFIMFPPMKTSPLTLLLHAPQLPASSITSLYATIYHLAVLTMKTLLQFITHLQPAPYYHYIPWVLQSHHPGSPTPYVMT